MKTPETWLDPAEGILTPKLPPGALLATNTLPPPDDWIGRAMDKALAEMKAEAARTGKPIPLPKVW